MVTASIAMQGSAVVSVVEAEWTRSCDGFGRPRSYAMAAECDLSRIAPVD
jgi:hypothetical protein